VSISSSLGASLVTHTLSGGTPKAWQMVCFENSEMVRRIVAAWAVHG
jgi:hypothetical protein